MSKKKTIKEYEFDDLSLMLGLVTIPFSKNAVDFYQKEFKDGLFKKYKRSLQVQSSDKDEINEVYKKDNKDQKYVYEPCAYYIFGEYDLCIISVVDDFTFGNRKFHPNATLETDDFDENPENLFDKPDYNYNYQVLTGLIPIIEKKTIVHKAKNTFLKAKEQFPYIGITRFKVNNGLLIGVGYELIYLINQLIKTEFNDKKEKQKLDYIIMESFCNNEITLITFSNSYICLAEKVLSIREKKFKDLQPIQNSDIPDFVKQSYLYKILVNLTKTEFINNAHLFTNSFTTFGYNCDLNSKPKLFLPPIKNEPIDFLHHWDVKPGHLHNAFNILENFRSDQQNLSIGHGVLSWNKNSPIDYTNILKSLKNDNGIDEFKHFNKLRTSVYIKKEIDTTKFAPVKNHFYLKDELKEYSFTLSQLRDIRKNLKKFRASKVLTGRIMNMYNNFNDCIEDPNLFMFFIEVHGFLKKIESDLTSYGTSLYSLELSNDDLHEILENQVKVFEAAYNNRFNQSYRMLNVTDFNLEFSGGVQQLISSLDASYKAIANIFGEDHAKSFAVISGNQGVDSLRYSVRLNYFHIFQPEIFIAIAVKEAANYYIPRLDFKKDSSYRPTAQVRDWLTIANTEPFLKIKLELKEKFEIEGIEIDKIYSILLNSISPYLTNYIFEDLLTFIVGYKFNFELFSYWYWNYFLQMSNSYDSDGKINTQKFCELLFRLTFIYKIYEKDGLVSADVLLLKPPTTELNDQFSTTINRVLKFYKMLMDIEDFKKWNDEIYTIVKSIVAPKFTTEQSEIENIKSFVKKNNLPKIHEIFKEILISDRNKSEQFYNNSKNYFTQGKVIDCDNNLQNNSASIFILQLFYSYLKFIMNENMGKNSLLIRDKNNLPMKFFNQDLTTNNLKENFGNILFDPLGGLYIHSFSNRKKYFKFRASIIKSMWNFSLKSKNNLLFSN